MKPVALVVAVWLLGGCAAQQMSLDPQMAASNSRQMAFDVWAVQSHEEAAVKMAILEQHALFPYHFIPGSTTLTELGQRDFALLTDYYRVTPAPLALVKADTADDLYARRKQAIASALEQAGLSAIVITDGPVGGLGVTGQSAVLARKEKKETYGTPNNTDTGSISDTGTVAPVMETK